MPDDPTAKQRALAEATSTRSKAGVGLLGKKARVAIAALSVVLFSAGCTSIDFARDKPSRCEVHGAVMAARRVRLAPMEIPGTSDEPRHRLFPHADDPFRITTCGLSKQPEYGRVFVCAQCLRAREKWLASRAAAATARPESPLGETPATSPSPVSSLAPRHP